MSSIHSWAKSQLFHFIRVLCYFDDLILIDFNGDNIETRDWYKYLGLWLDARLTFENHVEHLSRKLKMKIFILKLIFVCHSQVVRSYYAYYAFGYCSTVYMNAEASSFCISWLITGDCFLTYMYLIWKSGMVLPSKTKTAALYYVYL